MAADDRFSVVAALKTKLKGQNVADLAATLGITIIKEGKINKGWVGQTLDKLSNTEAVNAQLPDGIDFELKSVHFISKDGELVPKETMAITMFNPETIISESFENSALWHKLERLILVGHTYLDNRRDSAVIKFVGPIDVTDKVLRGEIQKYWESIKKIVQMGGISEYSSKGTSDGYVQLRTKGSGTSKSRCPVTGKLFNTRAFYATKTFLRYVRGNLG